MRDISLFKYPIYQRTSSKEKDTVDFFVLIYLFAILGLISTIAVTAMSFTVSGLIAAIVVFIGFACFTLFVPYEVSPIQIADVYYTFGLTLLVGRKIVVIVKSIMKLFAHGQITDVFGRGFIFWGIVLIVGTVVLMATEETPIMSIGLALVGIALSFSMFYDYGIFLVKNGYKFLVSYIFLAAIFIGLIHLSLHMDSDIRKAQKNYSNIYGDSAHNVTRPVVVVYALLFAFWCKANPNAFDWKLVKSYLDMIMSPVIVISFVIGVGLALGFYAHHISTGAYGPVCENRYRKNNKWMKIFFMTVIILVTLYKYYFTFNILLLVLFFFLLTRKIGSEMSFVAIVLGDILFATGRVEVILAIALVSFLTYKLYKKYKMSDTSSLYITLSRMLKDAATWIWGICSVFIITFAFLCSVKTATRAGIFRVPDLKLVGLMGMCCVLSVVGIMMFTSQKIRTKSINHNGMFISAPEKTKMTCCLIVLVITMIAGITIIEKNAPVVKPDIESRKVVASIQLADDRSYVMYRRGSIFSDFADDYYVMPISHPKSKVTELEHLDKIVFCERYEFVIESNGITTYYQQYYPFLMMGLYGE